MQLHAVEVEGRRVVDEGRRVVDEAVDPSVPGVTRIGSGQIVEKQKSQKLPNSPKLAENTNW